MKLYAVVVPNDQFKLGTLFNRDDDGWEQYEWRQVPGEPRAKPIKKSNVLIPHSFLSRFLAPINNPRESRFVLDANGHVYLKDRPKIILGRFRS